MAFESVETSDDRSSGNEWHDSEIAAVITTIAAAVTVIGTAEYYRRYCMKAKPNDSHIERERFISRIIRKNDTECLAQLRMIRDKFCAASSGRHISLHFQSGMKQRYYVVFVGRNPGIYSTWDACNAQVNGFSGCRHKSFTTFADAMKAWNEYQASFPDLTVRHTTVSGATCACHRHSAMDSGNCVPDLTDWTDIDMRNVREDGRAERVPVAEVVGESYMAPLLRLLLGLTIFYFGIRFFCRTGYM